MEHLRLTNRQKGILLMASSAFCFAAMQIAINRTSGSIPLMEQIFARNIISLFICLIFIRRHGGSYFGKRSYQPLLFVRSFFGFMGFITMFYAVSHAHQADATILIKLSPFMITLWAALFLKERISRIQLPALLLAFAGAALVANPVFSSDLRPLLVALLCAFFSSVSYTLLAYFKNKVDGMTVIMHFSTFTCLATVPFLLLDFAVPTAYEAFLLLLVGVFGGLGQIALTYSYRMAPAAEVSVYNYAGILFSMLLGYLCLGERLSWNSLLGGALVIVASILVYRYSNRFRKSPLRP